MYSSNKDKDFNSLKQELPETHMDVCEYFHLAGNSTEKIAEALRRAYKAGRIQNNKSSISHCSCCECPQGSLCEFFTENELCQYGKI